MSILGAVFIGGPMPRSANRSDQADAIRWEPPLVDDAG